MIEGAWACALLIGLTRRETRALALLLTAKWAANYLAFAFIVQSAPVYIDILAGTAGVMLASRKRGLWADIVTACFVATPLAHAWFWLHFAQPLGDPNRYFLVITALFTAQVLATAWPGARAHVRNGLRWLDGAHRSGLACRDGVAEPLGRGGSRNP